MKTKLFLLVLVVFIPLAVTVYAQGQDDHSGHEHSHEVAHEDHSDHAHDKSHDDHTDHSGHDEEEHVHKEPTKEEMEKIGVDEKLGEIISLNAEFATSDGKIVTLKEIVDKPTIFAPVYFGCPNVCNFLQSSLANVAPEIKLEAGKDFQIVSISFDEYDTPAISSSKKVNYMKAAGDFPPEAWIFLNGDKKNIDKFTDSIGYNFFRRGKDFAHPVAVAVVSPSGKIARYLYGTKILPFELTMAVVEASKEQTGLSVRKLVSYCFSYDPQGKKYVFNVMRVSGFVVLSVLIIFARFLFFGGKRRK